MLRKKDSDRRAVSPANAATKRARRGRPSRFSREITERICERIFEGESLRQICKDPNLPARSTIFRWLRRDKDFVRRYSLTKLMQIDDMTSELIELADCDRHDWTKPGVATAISHQLSEQNKPEHTKARIDSLRSRVGKLVPKKYAYDFFRYP